MIYINDTELIEFYQIPETEIQKKTIGELQQMTNIMKQQKAENEAMRNAEDNEFIRIVKKYFTPYEFLKQYFSEEKIILACSRHLTKRDIVSEEASRTNQCWHNDAEFLRQEWANMPVYYNGHKLEERERVYAYIFQIKNQYQGIHHGKVILDLLYDKYPELQQYKFDAYEYYDYSNSLPYEIYPYNHIYTPFDALMNKDIDAIKDRNLKYAKSYNCGDYTIEKVQERLASKDAEEFFQTILNLAD